MVLSEDRNVTYFVVCSWKSGRDNMFKTASFTLTTSAGISGMPVGYLGLFYFF
jgi:hypothetical protein